MRLFEIIEKYTIMNGYNPLYTNNKGKGGRRELATFREDLDIPEKILLWDDDIKNAIRPMLFSGIADLEEKYSWMGIFEKQFCQHFYFAKPKQTTRVQFKVALTAWIRQNQTLLDQFYSQPYQYLKAWQDQKATDESTNGSVTFTEDLPDDINTTQFEIESGSEGYYPSQVNRDKSKGANSSTAHSEGYSLSRLQEFQEMYDNIFNKAQRDLFSIWL